MIRGGTRGAATVTASVANPGAAPVTGTGIVEVLDPVAVVVTPLGAENETFAGANGNPQSVQVGDNALIAGATSQLTAVVTPPIQTAVVTPPTRQGFAYKSTALVWRVVTAPAGVSTPSSALFSTPGSGAFKPTVPGNYILQAISVLEANADIDSNNPLSPTVDTDPNKYTTANYLAFQTGSYPTGTLPSYGVSLTNPGTSPTNVISVRVISSAALKPIVATVPSGVSTIPANFPSQMTQSVAVTASVADGDIDWTVDGQNSGTITAGTPTFNAASGTTARPATYYPPSQAGTYTVRATSHRDPTQSTPITITVQAVSVQAVVE